MPNLAYVLGCLARHCGGPPRVAVSLGREMDKIGFGVSFWSTGQMDSQQEVAKTNLDMNLYETIWPKVWFRAPALIEGLCRQINSIDLIHLHEVWSHPQYAAARLARRYRTAYLITPHGELEPWRVRSKGLKKHIYLALLGRRMLDGAACLHAVTPLEVDGFRKAGYKGPVTVIPNAVNPDDFADMPSRFEAEARWPELTGRRVVLFLSRLSREKGLDQLIPAWADLTAQNSYDDGILVLAGPDDRGYRATAEALVERFGIASCVLFTDMVCGREKIALISRADICTLPSYSEGFSISVLENLAAGKVVLLTDGCNFPEVAEVGAGLCVRPEQGALKEALRTLLDMSESKRAVMGEHGRNLVCENYTWDISARKMATVYRCILEGRNIPLYPEPAIV